jgi:phage regulator Rha-like protein
MDCLEHPEYLKDVLNQVFGRSHDSIIKSIEKNLAEFANQRPIAEFLAAMSE